MKPAKQTVSEVTYSFKGWSYSGRSLFAYKECRSDLQFFLTRLSRNTIFRVTAEEALIHFLSSTWPEDMAKGKVVHNFGSYPIDFSLTNILVFDSSPVGSRKRVEVSVAFEKWKNGCVVANLQKGCIYKAGCGSSEEHYAVGYDGKVRAITEGQAIVLDAYLNLLKETLLSKKFATYIDEIFEKYREIVEYLSRYKLISVMDYFLYKPDPYTHSSVSLFKLAVSKGDGALLVNMLKLDDFPIVSSSELVDMKSKMGRISLDNYYPVIEKFILERSLDSVPVDKSKNKKI